MIPSFFFLGRTFTIYPLMALAGIFVAGIYACRAAKRAGQNEDDMIMLLLISSFGVFLGMHLLYGLVGIPQWSAQMDQIHGLASFFSSDGRHVGRLRVFTAVSWADCWQALATCARRAGPWAFGPAWQLQPFPSFIYSAGLDASWADAATGFPPPGGLSTDTVRLLRPTGLSAFRCSWWKRPGIWCSSCSWPGYSGGKAPFAAPVSGPLYPRPVSAGVLPRRCIPGNPPGAVHLPMDQPVSLPRRPVRPPARKELTKISHPALSPSGDLWYTCGRKLQNSQEEMSFADLQRSDPE